jgi:hypothetical protein
MKERILLILSLILIVGSFAFAQTARRTITNEDLEKYRQARVKSEAEYRENYKKLGMPSPEELEKREAERRVWLEEYSNNKKAENQQAQGYFQLRANQLKSEIVGAQAQINYLRAQVGRLPSRQNSIFVRPEDLCAVSVLPYGYFPPPVGGVTGGYYNRQNNAQLQAPNAQLAINNAGAAPNPHAGTVNAQAGVKVVVGQQPDFRRRGGYNRHYRPYVYGGGYYPTTCATNNNSEQREDFISRLSYLEQTKSGLLAQLELLREEARRAGVRID